jgi:hypothetical protein
MRILIPMLFILSLVMGFSLTAAAVDAVSSSDLSASAAAMQISDIQGNWAEPQIRDWVNKGLAAGYEDGTFGPDNNISRAEFMALANRAFGFKSTVSTSFSDVSAADWFAGEVGKALDAGYISGYQDGNADQNCQAGHTDR